LFILYPASTIQLLFGVCWGSSVPLLKVAVDAGHHPLGMILWQLTVSVLMLGGYVLSTGKRLAISAPVIRYMLIIAFLGT